MVENIHSHGQVACKLVRAKEHFMSFVTKGSL